MICAAGNHMAVDEKGHCSNCGACVASCHECGAEVLQVSAFNADLFISALTMEQRAELHRKLSQHEDIAGIAPDERTMAERGFTIEAVRAWRTRTSLGLAEAKTAFERHGLWVGGPNIKRGGE